MIRKVGTTQGTKENKKIGDIFSSIHEVSNIVYKRTTSCYTKALNILNVQFRHHRG